MFWARTPGTGASVPLIKSATKAPHEDWGPTVPKASPLPLPLRDLKTLWRQYRERGEWAGQIYAHKNCPNYHKLLGNSKKFSLSLSHSHKPPDLEWRLEECLSVGAWKNWCEIWYLPSVNVELCSRAWNLMSPLVISSTRNEATSTTQRLPSQLCNNQHSIRNNENFRAIILTWLQLISFYHCSAQRWGLNACTL